MPRGELLVALVGPSGCGKTTTLKMINRLIEPTGGRIEVGGADVASSPVHELRRGIGYVIQQAGLFPHRSVGENIATVPELLGWDKARRRSPGATSWPTWSASTPTCSAATRRRCRAGSSNASAWPGPWPPTRRSC